jgi:hypothetical protein
MRAYATPSTRLTLYRRPSHRRRARRRSGDSVPLVVELAPVAWAAESAQHERHRVAAVGVDDGAMELAVERDRARDALDRQVTGKR